jgi:hypothetical protein
MARITHQQIATLNILDWLYFNQVLVFSAYSQNDREWLKRIIDRVSDSVSETGVTGLKSELLKHYVLCLLEIFLSDDLLDKPKIEVFGRDINIVPPAGIDAGTLHRVLKYYKNFFSAVVIESGELAHKESLIPAQEIARDLLEHFCGAPVSVRYRLAERCLTYEFKNTPLDCFSWLAKLEVIRSAKYQSKDWVTPLPEQVIMRIGLLCEFEILRKLIGRMRRAPNLAEMVLKHKRTDELPESVTNPLVKNRQQLETLAYDKSLRETWIGFDFDRQFDPRYIAYFFTQVSHYFHRIRLWQGTQASWLGMLGGFIVEMERSCSCTNKPIYIELNNGGTITDDVSTFLRERGFSITGRTLYSGHRLFKEEIKSKVCSYYALLSIAKVTSPPEYDDVFYYATAALR